MIGCGPEANAIKPNATNGRSYLAAWAQYYVYWLEGYKRAGVDIWGVTPQNEPGYRAQGYECCIYSAAGYTEWVGRYLGPTLRAYNASIKILVYDFNKDGADAYLSGIASNYSEFADGVAYHWYDYQGSLGLATVQAVSRLLPNAFTLATEACYLQGLVETWATGAELVALDTIADLNFGFAGWVCWNSLLHTGVPSSYQGGPAHDHSSGFSAPMLFDQDGTPGGDALRYQTSFWAMGHVSRYARPGSVRVAAAGPGFAATSEDFETVRATVVNGRAPPAGGLPLIASAFVDDAAGTASVVVVNAGPTPVTFKLTDDTRPAASRAVAVTIPAHTIQSYRWLLDA